MENLKSSAFPVKSGDITHLGLTKLEYFTVMAMQGLISNPEWMEKYEGEKHLMRSETLARVAIERAKETLKQLEKEK